MTETLREAEDWRPPQWVAIQPNKVYFKALDMSPEECKRWLLETMRGCMTGERVAGSDADRLLADAEVRMNKRTNAGRKAANIRWGNAGCERNANALPTHSERKATAKRTDAAAMRNDATDSTVHNRTGQDIILGERSIARASARPPAREETSEPAPKPTPPHPADEASDLGYGVYAEVAESIALMLPKEISPARLYSVAALKELTPAELEGFVAHYSGRGWEFPTRREEKPRPITDKNLLSAISSWALKKDNYTQGGTRGTGNANRNRDRVFDPARPVQTQRGDIDYDPGF